eukprot:2615917-Rhodomonas_salina.1
MGSCQYVPQYQPLRGMRLRHHVSTAAPGPPTNSTALPQALSRRSFVARPPLPRSRGGIFLCLIAFVVLGPTTSPPSPPAPAPAPAPPAGAGAVVAVAVAVSVTGGAGVVTATTCAAWAGG